MKYQINKSLHNDFKIFEKNKLPARAYSIPFSSAEKLKSVKLSDERFSSDIVTLLSGEWDFKHYKSITALPDKLDTLKVRFNKVTVPSDWQRTGFEEPVYLNCPYETNTMEPDLPDDMTVGVYRKVINIASLNKDYIISFLGVANNISLYVNGKFAGYSEGSHNTAEFNITNLLSEGANELLCVSFKWCNGTFLECQDMFRENGIFRDVLLYAYPKTYIYDYEINTEKTDSGYNLSLCTVINGTAAGETEVSIFDAANKKIASQKCSAGESITFENLNVTEWNAELPVIYTVYITLKTADGTMSLRNMTGFRTISIENGVFKVNGTPIKIKGVNHHDTNLYKGYAMSLEDMEKDVKLMKSLNVNGVRTSHYPPDPYFLMLADVYGLYIIDEADIETHGCWEMCNDINRISHNPVWAKHYVDRVKRMYNRDKNRFCVIMWSLGNESGGYKCQDACYKYLKSTGTDIPVHYEGVVRTDRFHYDVISEMYTSTNQMESMLNNTRSDMNGYKSKKWTPAKIKKEYTRFPFFLCEYAHAMGVGPGNLEEYWDVFYEWNNSMGGCIWEWADHAVYHDENDKKYKYRYTYGGDHGEKKHDGHFCVDGLMYADRKLHTGAKEMKVVYRPLRASVAGKKLYCFENTNRFRASDYIDIKWILLVNGEKIKEGKLNVNIAPMNAECIEINHPDFAEDKDCHLNFVYTDKTTGEEIAVEQLTLNDTEYEYDIEIGKKIAAEVEDGIVTVCFENGKAVFDGKAGELCSYIANGEQLLAEKPSRSSGFNPNLYRALIDNDAANRNMWAEKKLNCLNTQLKSFDVHIDDGEIIVESKFTLNAGRKAMYDYSIKYTVSSLGAMEVNSYLKAVSDEAATDIPRFGLLTDLNKSFESCTYYGRGTAENMPDFKCQSPVGIYTENIDDMYEKYVYPQESGMHCDTKWIELKSKTNSLKIFADSTLTFSVHHFTQDMINKAQHQEDVKNMNLTQLSLDGFVRGIGSSSCGPDTRAEYKGNAAEGFALSFTIIPEVK